MNLLAPAAALFGLAIPAIVGMYFLKVRRPEQEIASTFLWQRAVADVQATTPWQRIRKSWLLLLQVIAALLFTIALVRPATHPASALASHTIIVIDRSATMQATDVAPSRFENAKTQAGQIIDQMGSSSRVTLISLDAHPRVLASSTGDPHPLRDALASLSSNLDAADLVSALSIATAAGGSARETRLVLLSDGITLPHGSDLSVPFVVDNRVIGSSADNCAITAVAVSGQTSSAPKIGVHVANYGTRDAQRSLEVRVDGHLIDARPVSIAAASGADITIAAPHGADHVDLTLTPHDVFPADDSATAVLRPPQTYNVTLVTAKNLYLQRALGLRPDVAVNVVAPSAYKFDPTVDMYVFDGFLPPSLPSVPYWITAPPKDSHLGTGDEVVPGAPRPEAAGDPLLTDVDLTGVHIAQTRDLRASQFGRSVMDSSVGPLLMVGDNSPRTALLGFDLHQSDLPLKTGFPILVDHISHFLLPGSAETERHSPGDIVPLITGAGSSSATVQKPDGSRSDIAVVGDAAVYDGTDQLGLYHVAAKGGHDLNTEFVINLFDPLRSNLQQPPPLKITPAPGAPTPTASESTAEWWPWIALLVLALLAGEWMVFHRGE